MFWSIAAEKNAGNNAGNNRSIRREAYIIVIGEAPSKFLNYYSGYNTIKQNSAGDILFDCSGDKVHVYVSEADYDYDTSFLSNEGAYNSNFGYYLGSFTPKGAK